MSEAGPEPELARVVMFGVPIGTFVRTSRALGAHCVKSAAQVTVRGGPPRTVFGFAFALDDASLDECVARSRFEVLERLFALPQLHGSRLAEPARVRRWGAELEPPPYTRGQLCLQEGGDSTGMAIHTELDAGSHGAVAELLERHLLGELWYARSIQVAHVPELSSSRGEFWLDHFVASSPEPLPLVLAVVTGPGRELAFCGSALDPDVRRAAHKAAAEALMLLDGHLEGDRGGSNSPGSSHRLEELGHRGRRELEPLLHGRPSVGLDAVLREDLPRLAARVLGPAPVDVASVEVREGLHLCRAFCDAARPLPWRRRARLPHQPVDPFC